MCTYATNRLDVSGSGKGTSEWIRISKALVYFDHPQNAMAEHTLNIDFLDPESGASARVAVELTADSAASLADAILATLEASVPRGGVPHQ